MRLLLACSLLTLALGACAPQRVIIRPGDSAQSTSGTSTTSNGAPPPPAPTGTPLASQMSRVEQHLGSKGFVRVGAVVHQRTMLNQALMAYPIDSEVGSCIIAVALSSQGADLNMVLLDPFGRTVAHDVRPDPHPWVHHCSETPGRFLARLQMASGSGEFYYAVFNGPPAQDPQLAALFGVVPTASNPSRHVQIDGATSGRLEAFAANYGRQGYTQVADARGVRMGPRQDRNFPLHLAANQCYAFASLAGRGARDTDVSIIDGEGTQLARDTRSDRDATVEFCPPTPGSYLLRVRLYEGEGPVFVAGWSRPSERNTDPATPTPAPVAVMEEISTAGASLDENFQLLNADMHARGYQSYEEPRRASLAQGQARRFRVNLEGGKCYAILAVGDAGTRDLDLVLGGAAGEEMDRDVETDARPIVRVCPEETGEHRVEVRMASGQGSFIFAAYRWPRGIRGPFGLSGLMWVRVAEVTSLLSVESYLPSESIEPGTGRLSREGIVRRHPLRLSGGQCYSVLAVGGDGVHDLDLTLSRGGTELASAGTRNAFPSVRFCAESAGRYDIKIRAASGSGGYFYQVFELREDSEAY